MNSSSRSELKAQTLGRESHPFLSWCELSAVRTAGRRQTNSASCRRLV